MGPILAHINEAIRVLVCQRLSNSVFTTLNSALLAPIDIASEATVIQANPGLCRSRRTANQKSANMAAPEYHPRPRHSRSLSWLWSSGVMRDYRERSELGWMALFAKVQQQWQSRRDTRQKHRHNRKPPRPAQPFAFKASEDKNH